MRPSVGAEKYIRDASACRKIVTDGNDNGTDGQTDRRTDRVRRNMRPPPREEGRITIIIIIITKIYIAPYGRNFRGSGGSLDQCSVKA